MTAFSIPRFRSPSARPGCCRRGGRSRPATKSFEPSGRPAGAESKASFAENAFREEAWVADLTSAHGWILRLIRAPFVTSFREGQIARRRPRHGRNSQATQQISCQNHVAVLYLFSYRHPSGDRRADRRSFEPRRFDRWDRARRQNGVARKWRRNGLKRLNPRPELVWSRKPRTHKMWYAGARPAVRDSS